MIYFLSFFFFFGNVVGYVAFSNEFVVRVGRDDVCSFDCLLIFLPLFCFNHWN